MALPGGVGGATFCRPSGIGNDDRGAVEKELPELREVQKREPVLDGCDQHGPEDDPQYRVRSEKSGNDAVHKPGALKKK